MDKESVDNKAAQPFRQFPKPMQDGIIKRIIFAIALNVMVSILAFGAQIISPRAVLVTMGIGMFLLISALMIYLVARNCNYAVFKGIVADVQIQGILPSMKRKVVQVSDSYMTMQFTVPAERWFTPKKKPHDGLVVGAFIALYANTNEPIEETDNGPSIRNHIAYEIIPPIEGFAERVQENQEQIDLFPHQE